MADRADASTKTAGSTQPATETFKGCFGCGTDNPVSMKLDFQPEGDGVEARTSVAKEYAGYREFVHGGVVATLLDEAMGWALLHATGNYGVTRNLNVTYRRPLTIDRPIVVRATIVETNGRTVRLAASIADQRGRVLASAEGDWSMVRKERAAGQPNQ